MNYATSSDKEAELQKPSKSAARLKLAREWHLYLGTLFAPSILFFALTGALQLFGLHEGHPGEAYQPPAWMQKLGSIHKNQTRIQGPKLIIEFSPQGVGGDPTMHVHTMYRDPTNDYGVRFTLPQ